MKAEIFWRGSFNHSITSTWCNQRGIFVSQNQWINKYSLYYVCLWQKKCSGCCRCYNRYKRDKINCYCFPVKEIRHRPRICYTELKSGCSTLPRNRRSRSELALLVTGVDGQKGESKYFRKGDMGTERHTASNYIFVFSIISLE